MIIFKAGVAWDTDKADSLEAVEEIFRAASKVYSSWGRDAVVTSLMDGRHKVNSKHYSGEAADFRIWGFEELELDEIVSELQSYLGDDFDVVLEETHIHIERDPKI